MPRTNPPKTTLSIENRHHPCLMNALFVLRPAKLRAFNFGHPCPSLVKGEVLSPDKIRATTGGIATPPTLPCTNPSKTAQSIENRHHPCLMNALFVLRPAKLRAFNFGHPCPSLVKGEVLSPDKIRATTGGIATPPFLASHQPLQNRTIPPAFRNANIYMHDTLSNSHYPIRFS